MALFLASEHTVRGGASEHTVQPKRWDQMSGNEQWWLSEYWNGNLLRKMNAAEAKCHTVEAKRFSIADDD